MEPLEKVCLFGERSACPGSPLKTVKASQRGKVLKMGTSLRWEELGSTGNIF